MKLLKIDYNRGFFIFIFYIVDYVAMFYNIRLHGTTAYDKKKTIREGNAFRMQKEFIPLSGFTFNKRSIASSGNAVH